MTALFLLLREILNNCKLNMSNLIYLNFFANVIGLIIVCTLLACQSKHKIVLDANIKRSEVLIPPKGCYKAKIGVSGILECETGIILIMDGEMTNFLNHIKLDKGIENRIIFNSDWYENTMQLNISNGACIKDKLLINVEFYN
jgi:hypothetical protein